MTVGLVWVGAGLGFRLRLTNKQKIYCFLLLTVFDQADLFSSFIQFLFNAGMFAENKNIEVKEKAEISQCSFCVSSRQFF